MRSTTAIARTIQAAILVAFALAWYAITASGTISRLLLPPPAEVGTAIARLAGTGEFWEGVGVTFSTVARAYLIAIVAGIGTGYLLTRSRLVMDALEPVLAGIFTIPLTLLLPMFILFFGIGPASKVGYGATYGFFPVALNTIVAFGHIDQRWLRAARSMGASRWQAFRHVLLPAALPVLVTGLRIGFVICFASVLGGETISSAMGIGHAIALNAELMEPARMYAWIAFVVAAAIAINLLISLLEARLGRKEAR